MKYASHAISLLIGILIGYVVARGVTIKIGSGSNETRATGQAVGAPEVSPAEAAIKAEAIKPAPRASVPPVTNPVQAKIPVLPKPGGGKPTLQELKLDFDKQLDLGNLRQATQAVQDMEKAFPNSQIYFESQGSLLAHQQQWEEAKTSLKKCVASYPDSKSCLLDLSTTELQTGSKEEQLAAVNDCLRTMPQHPICRDNAGMVYLNQGDYSGAISMYEQLIKDNGSYGFRFADGLLEWQLGTALEGAGRVEEAEDHFENACRSNWQPACDHLEK